MNKSFLSVFSILLFLCLSCGCAKKVPHSPAEVQSSSQELEDIKDFPQNLQIYAQEFGASKLLLAGNIQEELYRKFKNTYFGPWEMRRITIPKKEMAAPFRYPGGYHGDNTRWSDHEWSIFRANANISAYPSRSIPAITLRQTNLREIPTNQYKFDKPVASIKEYPFDYFQYSLLPPGMPILIGHTSLDGQWHYIECPIAGGWVEARDVAFIDESFKNLWQAGQFVALIRDEVNLPGTGINQSDSSAGIGTILPLKGKPASTCYKVLVPVKNSQGFADTAEIDLDMKGAVLMPFAITAGNVAQIGNQMMGQPYGWGGTLGRRDCSAMIRDLFTPFGLWLPRNSRAQAKRGAVISLAGLSASDKDRIIINEGVPFLSLVGLPGHITLYVGPWKNKAALFHNAWGLRIIKDGNDDERYIIGRAVVTSIAPGMELPNLYRPKTFADRIRSLNTLGK